MSPEPAAVRAAPYPFTLDPDATALCLAVHALKLPEHEA